MKILLGGALGRMGREVTAAAAEAQVEIVCGVDVAYTGQPSDYPIVTAFDQATQKADVLIDFSRPSALPELLQLARKEKMPTVLCATGYNEAELQMIEEASREIPVFRSANMSLGVNVLRHLVQEAARALGEDFDVEIVERHHRMKADSPSGTALMLYDSVKDATETLRQPVFGRYGRTAQRQPGEVGIHAVRGGTISGEHEVCFYGDGEELILTHRAEKRSLFARGALRAAAFLMDKSAGKYDMQDLIEEMLR